MDRPTPKQPITITVYKAYLTIVVSGPEEKKWIEREGPIYGRLFNMEGSGAKFWLHVHEDMYDVEQVLQWLLTPK